MKIGSTPNIEGIANMLNEYFFSTSYRYDNGEVSNKFGLCPHITVVQKKGRYYITVNQKQAN